MTYNDKYKQLINYLQSLEKLVVAFSGGVDSTFLLKAAKEALGNNVKAITIASPYIPKWEIQEAKELANKIGVEHQIVEVSVSDEIRTNPENRCYLCKKFVFSMIKDISEEEFNYVADGSNFDDTKDYRPGMKALKEMDIKSPLLEVGLTKTEIRELSRELDLSTWDKPPYACLLTRIPYGSELKEEEFIRIEESEKYLMDIGFRAVRVRSHGDVARIEVPKNDIKRLFDEELLVRISQRLKNLGFKYVALDLEGYRMGSFNETLKNQ